VPAFYEKFTSRELVESTRLRRRYAIFRMCASSFYLQIPTGKHWAASILWEIQFGDKLFYMKELACANCLLRPLRSDRRAQRVASAPASPKEPAKWKGQQQPHHDRWAIFGKEQQDAHYRFDGVLVAGDKGVVEARGNGRRFPSLRVSLQVIAREAEKFPAGCKGREAFRFVQNDYKNELCQTRAPLRRRWRIGGRWRGIGKNDGRRSRVRLRP
jgi:hypothetical protein